MKLRLTIAVTVLTVTAAVMAQETTSSSIYLNPAAKSDVTLSFSLTAEGHQFEPTWGLDQAWISRQNMLKGINHMGKENVGIGRTCFRMTKALTNDVSLTSEQTSKMIERNNILNLAGTTLPLVFTADQEAGTDDYYLNVNGTTVMANTERWAAMINAHVQWMKTKTKHPVAGVSPFNEPDYWSNEEGATPALQSNIAKLLRENYAETMEGVNIVGGNTLNDDKALLWYNTGKQYYDWGNTHQLAGSFANFASFFQRVTADGKVGYADEMHNVGEAMVGLEYGMTVGIWWGFDSRARGEFCDISRHGRRLAYGEHRNNWTAASVYRHDVTGAVKAFIGSSERQAYTTSYQLVSTDRPVYYDGHGPLRELRMEIPGGTGYQQGQTNAERVIDILWGDDVPPRAIEAGTYIVMNKGTQKVMAERGVVDGNTNISQDTYTGKATQQWNIVPSDPRCGGDYSFYDFTSVNDGKRPDVLNFSTSGGGNVIAWTNEKPSSNEQWYLQYAGDGYYFIRNRESALYLSMGSDSSGDGVSIVQQVLLTGDKLNRQLWRILPVDAQCEVVAPAQPQGLTAMAQTAAVVLQWEPNTEDDLDGYMILRAERGTDDWNTIARRVKTTRFVENTCSQGVAYDYCIKAIDYSDNQSERSLTVSALPSGKNALIAWWPMDGNTADQTLNMMDAVSYDKTPQYIDGAHEGKQALKLNGSTSYVQLPYEVANTDELTIALWVNWRSGDNWQRIFDFGIDTDHYMFLTPSNGSAMRFAIKNGGEEQTLDCTKLTVRTWKHVAVAIGHEATTIYVDGEAKATTDKITIKPSDIHPLLNYLGRSQFNADPMFNGYVCDVRIYNYALSEGEVADMMNNIPTGIGDAETFDNLTISQFDHSSLGEVYDLQGRRVNGQGSMVRSTSGRLQGKNGQLSKGIYIRGGKKVVIK